MAKKQQPPIQQTTIGDGNIQVAGDNNTVNVTQTIVQKISNFFTGDTEQVRAQRNRRAMLQLVRNIWIKGVLEKSLYNEVLVQLDMEERPGAVKHPWDMQVHMPDRKDRTLPKGTSIMQVLDEMNGAMLILGEPGSGKTTMLLELASACIERAQQDVNRQIPVVFNLSSWDGNQTIDDWLVDELRTKYNVSKKTAQDWVTNEDLQLLLDGLDEVRSDKREGCVKAINDFRQQHGLNMPIAVCSRIADYEALINKLSLSGAVLLQSLTTEQIEEYFERAGSGLEGVHQALLNDEKLREMVKQPLMLSVLALTYQGASAQAVDSQQPQSPEVRRQHLFDTYIQQMFGRVARTKNERYSPERTKHWLSWLAQKMIANNAVPYFIENMQPNWLGRKNRLGYWLSVMLSSELISLPVAWLFFSLVIAVLLLIGAKNVSLNDILTWASIAGLVIMCISTTPIFLGGIIVGLIFGNRSIKMIDTIALDWKRAIGGLVIGVGVSGLVGMLTLLIFGSAGNLLPKLVTGLTFGLLFAGPVFGLIGGLVGGIKAKDILQTTYPGQRLYLSIRNSLLVFLFIGLIICIFFLLYFIQFLGWEKGHDLGLIFGTMFGVFGALIGSFGYGGFTVIQHYNLRVMLSINNFLPWRITPFLDYCVDRIFLRRVGGGYIFVHRLLMEHFAAMYPEEK